jgi:hypothetical protein
VIELATVAFFALACFIAIRNPAWAVALVFVMYSIEQALQSTSGIFLRIPPLANVCVGLAVGSCLVGALTRLHRPFYGYATPQLYAMTALFAWAALSLFWSPSAESGLGMTRWGLPYVLLMVYAAPLLIDDVESLERFLLGFLLIGTCTCVLIILSPGFTVKNGRLGIDIGGGFRTNPLAIGELGGMLLMTGVLCTRPAGSVVASSVLRTAACLFGGYLALQSGSRGQLIFALLISICFVPIARRINNIARFFGLIAIAMTLVPLAMWTAQTFLGSEDLRRWDLSKLADGAAVRNNNILDLFRAFATDPLAWFAGLGYNAFTSVTPTLEPYSHILFVDVLTELGIPMFILLLWWLKKVVNDGLWLFRRYANQPDQRANLACLFAMFAFQLLIVNKQGYLWMATLFFLPGVMITRLRLREERLDLDELEASTDNEDHDETSMERHPA